VLLASLSALLLALLIDRWLGEPPVRWHPVVWMGHYLGWAGRQLQRQARPDGPDYRSFWLGTLAWLGGAAMVIVAALAIEQLAMVLPVVLAALLLGLALKPLLAWRMLRTEVQAVEQALQQSLAAGRERLSWLVSRDVSALSEAGVRESAIESLAENLNDSVVAPLFWFALLGLPGAALYRFANTADAMWGYRGVYRGQRWEWAGKWAARVDDVLSWLPARLTAALLLLAAGGRGLRLAGALRQEAVKTPSPNSGWPMAAMALVLDVTLRKPLVYGLNPGGRAAQAADTGRAAVYAEKTLLALMAVALIAIVYVAIWGVA
jgi:adenosylcobinamide-phosphate synthase